MRAGQEGVARVRFTVEPSGKVVGMLLVQSTGFELLDAATLAAMRSCQFAPGTLDGKPVKAQTIVQYGWRIAPESK
jgi:TonB family protein